MSRNGRIIGSNPDDWGSIPSWMVARMSGLSKRRLAAWARSGLIIAGIGKEDPRERFYSWYQFERARIAAKLIEHGLSPKKVRHCLDALDQPYRAWVDESCSWIEVKRHRFEHDGRVLTWDTTNMPPPDAMTFLGADAPGTQSVSEAWRSQLPATADIECIVADLIRETPLGMLHEFNGRIEMLRGCLGAIPCLAGTRMGTDFFVGWSVEHLLEGWPDLPVEAAQSIVTFNKALRSSPAAYAAVA